MQTRPLGRTGLTVTPLGLGLAALGRPGYINLGHAQDLNADYDAQTMQARTGAVLEAAWNAGIRYFDAARSYGRAEEFLANWLGQHDFAAHSVTVGSKWGYTYTADWQVHADKHEIKDHSLPLLKRQIQESRDLLGSHLRLYQIHSATLESGVLENQTVLDELTEYRNRGLIIGLTVSGPRQAETIKKALDIRRDRVPLFGVVQATWNLLERSATTALQEAHDAGLGVIIKEALANGRLTSRNDTPSQRQQLERAAEQQHATIDALALAAVLAQPWVDVVLSGAATLGHLHGNLAALSCQWTPDLAARFEPLSEEPATYWAKRNLLAWN
jgi:aryl-alcohol dehydrogenase-like predicted oxidoreductase